MADSLELSFYISYVLLVVLVLFQGIVLLGLVKVVTRLQATPLTLDPYAASAEMSGREVPEFQVLDTAGRLVDSSSLGTLGAVLLFVSTDCVACSASLNELEALKQKKGELVVVCRGSASDCIQLLRQHQGDVSLVVDADRKISNLFRITAVPTAVVISAGGIESYGSPFRNGELARIPIEPVAQLDSTT